MILMHKNRRNRYDRKYSDRKENRRRKKRTAKRILLVLLVFVFYILIQYCWLSLIARPVEAYNVTAFKGEPLSLSDFVTIPKASSNPFYNITAVFMNEPDSQILGEVKMPIIMYNKTGYFDVVVPTLNVVSGRREVAVDKEMTADEITAGLFVNTDDVRAKMVSVPQEPEYDPGLGLYVYNCVMNLGGREIPCRVGIPDKTKPVITGVHDIEVMPDTSILYKEGVSVSDNLDKDVKLEIESDVISSQPGTYTVTYRAKDKSGNETTETATVRIKSAEEEYVVQRADEILAQILTPDMTKREQAKAIYNWIRSNMRYAAAPHTDDPIEGAHHGFTLGHGDCFTYYAVSEALLTRAGIDNMKIQRVPESPVDHFWNLVNVGDGWYHFDPCPPYVPFDGFMFTDSQAKVYAEMQVAYRLRYYDYVKENYPPVVQ